MRVRAQDGTTTQTYTVTEWRAAPHGASSNAFLGTLALARSSGVGLPMSPGFRVFETAYTASVYTASVADPSPWVTVTPDPDHEDATVDYLDGDGNALADADGVTDGFQVNLEAGDNVIGVRVRAQDRITTKTYTVTVTLAEYVWHGPGTFGA